MPSAIQTHQKGTAVEQHHTLLAIASSFLVLCAWSINANPVTILAAAGLPLAFMLCVRSPLLVAALFMSITYFRIHDAYPVLEPLKLPLILGVLLLTSIAIQWFVTGRIVPYWTTEIRLLVALVALVAIGTAFAKNREFSWEFFSSVYWKYVIVTFAIAWIARSIDDFNKISRILILSGIAIAAVAIYNKIYGLSLVEGTRVTIARKPTSEDLGNEVNPYEISSTLADPNDLALILLFPLAFAISSLVYRSGPINVLLGLVGSVTTTLAIIFTQSRGGLLGVLAVLGIMGLRVIKSRTVVISLGVAAALGLAAAMGLSSRISGGAQEISESGIDDSSLGRLIAWRAAISMAVARPLTGVGVNGFIDAYHFFSEVPNRREKAVHSTWFQVLGETGFPGLILFLTLVVVTFRTAIRNVTRLAASQSSPILMATALSLVTGMASFCVAGTFLTQAFTLPLYVLIGLTVAVSRAIDLQHSGTPLETETQPWQPAPPLQPITRHLPKFGWQPPLAPSKPTAAADRTAPVPPRKLLSPATTSKPDTPQYRPFSKHFGMHR